MDKFAKATTVRLGELEAEIADIARMGGVLPSDVIRLCVKYGLPIVRAGFQKMEELGTSQIKKPKAKARELATK